ncbi:MAG: DUF1761 domain-containing protein [bacterium]|nr:DUF1761 domain-containing protein [bacterium]
MEISINYVAVLVAGVINMVIGALWYSPVLFGNKWMKLMGWNKESVAGKKKGMGARYFANFVAALLMAYVIAHLVYLIDALTWQEGVQLGFWTWLGFVATVSLGTVLWEGKPKALYFLNIAYYFVTFLVMGAILAVWR